MLDFNIIGSGSSGNAVRVGHVMFDCGMPFAAMKEDLYKCHSLLITHEHSDHVKAATLKQIRTQFPRITIYANPSVAYRFHVNHVIGTAMFELKDGTEVRPFECVHDVETTGFMLHMNGTEVRPFECVHDVETTGFMLHMNGEDILYATDTAEINIPKDARFDWFFIESNYDETKLREISGKYRSGRYDPADSQYRHLSTQQAKAVYYTHRKSRDSQFIELHRSGRFY